MERVSNRFARWWTKSLTLSMGLVLLLLASSCGGDDPTPTSPPAPTATPVPAATPTPVPAGDPTPTPMPVDTTEPWEAEWEQLIEDANEEGKLVVTVFRAEDREAVELFEDFFPEIDVDAQIIGGRDFTARVPPERAAGIFDYDVYISGGTSAITRVIPAGEEANDPILGDTRSLLIRPDVVDDSNWIGGLDAQFMDSGRKVLFKMIANPGSSSLYVNTDLVDLDMIQWPGDLLRPEFKGKICADDPSTPGSGATFFTEILVTQGEELIRRIFRETDIVISRDHRKMGEDIIRGDMLLCIGPSVLDFHQQGVGLHVVQHELNFGPISPEFQDKLDVTCCGVTSGHIQGFYSAGVGGPAIVTKGPNPKAAQLFINWLLSPEGARTWFEHQLTDCSPRHDLVDLCRERKDFVLEEGKAYITFHDQKNVAHRRAAQAIAGEELN